MKTLLAVCILTASAFGQANFSLLSIEPRASGAATSTREFQTASGFVNTTVDARQYQTSEGFLNE